MSEKWILTAAHCLEFGNVPDFIDRLTISIGDHDLSVRTETKSIIRHISKVSFFFDLNTIYFKRQQI